MQHEIGKKTVFVGLSGGVDSAVSAYLLQQEGYDVHGIFIQTWTPEWMECGWREDRRDAMRVAIHLNIPFHDLDLSREYKEGVADYMIAEYRVGRTPNPDVMCNREVKFGGFLQYALSCGADYIATGHYARVGLLPLEKGETERGFEKVALASDGILDSKVSNPSLILPFSRRGDLHLLRGIDSSKDQSYFLWTLTTEQLKHILFPVGCLPKSETRSIAERAKLPVATKKDSQGICFLGAVDMEEFLSHYIKHKIGDVLDTTGNKIGIHTGVWFVTLGQRFAGDIVDSRYRGVPLYIVAKDVDTNSIIVADTPNPDRGMGSKHKTYTTKTGGSTKLVNCVIRNSEFKTGYVCTAQIRYHGELLKCSVVSIDGDEILLDWFTPPVIVAPGQSVVLYDGDICIGGGIVV